MTRLNYRTLAGLAGLAFTLYNMWRRRPDYVARQMSKAGHTTLPYSTTGTTRAPVGGAVV